MDRHKHRRKIGFGHIIDLFTCTVGHLNLNMGTWGSVHLPHTLWVTEGGSHWGGHKSLPTKKTVAWIQTGQRREKALRSSLALGHLAVDAQLRQDVSHPPIPLHPVSAWSS